VLAKLLVEAAMQYVNKVSQLLIQGWKLPLLAQNIEGRSHTFLQDRVGKGLLLITFLVQDFFETFLGHFKDDDLFSLEEFEENSDDFGLYLHCVEVDPPAQNVLIRLCRAMDLWRLVRDCIEEDLLPFFKEEVGFVLNHNVADDCQAFAYDFAMSSVIRKELVQMVDVFEGNIRGPYASTEHLANEVIYSQLYVIFHGLGLFRCHLFIALRVNLVGIYEFICEYFEELMASLVLKSLDLLV